jgi:hypothetical protein
MLLPSGGFFSLAAWLVLFSAVRQRRAARFASAVAAVER